MSIKTQQDCARIACHSNRPGHTSLRNINDTHAARRARYIGELRSAPVGQCCAGEKHSQQEQENQVSAYHRNHINALSETFFL
jgi:hypothetical protein